MYVVFPNGEIDDPDMEQLEELLHVLDYQFAQNITYRKETGPPLQNAYWDRLSYIAGLGFVMCQQYINITYPTDGFRRKSALEMPPKHLSGHSVAQLINATANYWKHYQEDVNYPYGSLRQSTIKILEDLGLSIESPYICELILDRIAGTEIMPFSKVVDLLIEWRGNLIQSAKKRLPAAVAKPQRSMS